MNLKSRFLFFLVQILFFSSSLLLVSCDEKRIFDEYKSVGKGWHKDSIVSFNLPKIDSSKSYNLFLNLRSNNNYSFNNIFLIVSLEQPNKKIIVDTLEYQMANSDGTLLGEGFTDVKESKLYYKEKMKLKPGNYTITIKQAVRKTGKIPGVEKLDGITDVGFRIEKLD